MSKSIRRKHKKITKTRRSKKGGSNLAYTGNTSLMEHNPHLAYTGKAYPSVGLSGQGITTIPTNQAGPQLGGGCGCGLMGGGSTHHRKGCMCSSCRMGMKGGNPGIPYPNGLVGKPWTPSIEGWSGVDGIQGNRNYLAPNEYKTDVQTAMISTGANPPFSVGGGRRRKIKKTQRGGAFVGQDLINLGRQFQFGLGSAYNGLVGVPSPVNSLPWKGQLVSSKF